ncbi:Methyltransferase domain-containing protein [Ectothiorhodospira magna]|uniref:Methyltransferase domain-containing protein n=1 Tax=Ectothiorhodospira magna TaxID=867345 RepID=A0A1H9B205_9GAMM|nr:Methyltransferase domain-containing protein [Ectothiorhodospira magna]
MRTWYATPSGRVLQGALQAHLDRFVPRLFGYHALQIGHTDPEHDLLTASRIHNRMQLACEPGQGHITALAEALPVLSDSMDLVLLNHCLESSPDPCLVLRETERILVPEGHVLIIGFNPFSPTGLWRMLPRRPGGKTQAGHVYSTARVGDWLTLLGFEVLACAYAGFYPRNENRPSGGRRPVVECLGGRHLPYLGGAYVILARKRVANMMPLSARWRSSGKMAPGRLASPFCRRTDRD